MASSTKAQYKTTFRWKDLIKGYVYTTIENHANYIFQLELDENDYVFYIHTTSETSGRGNLKDEASGGAFRAYRLATDEEQELFFRCKAQNRYVKESEKPVINDNYKIF